MSELVMDLLDTLVRARVIPVISIGDSSLAVPLARALVKGGLNVLEITLRTGGALEAINRIRQEIEDVIVGAGTIINTQQIESAAKIGADFIVSPGLTEDLLHAA
jgi:2-dehydro-3-deoxyphosphogluconate aldolase/(4S)-4-hydroxy-2-oxoglutarate aldolase